MKKKIGSLIMIVILLLQLNPASLYANGMVGNTETGYVVISLEGMTLGQGLYIEPTLISYDEIVDAWSLYGEEIDPDNITAAQATYALFSNMGIAIQSTGSFFGSGFYLSAIKNIDTGEINIPSIITKNSGVDNSSHDENSDEWLGEFDYNYMSGWMITVDNFMIDVSAGDWILDNNSKNLTGCDNTHVIRWQFTLSGYGSDLGVDTGWGDPSYFEGADKSGLNKLYAEIKAYEPAFFTANAAAKASALETISKLTATQAEVDNAMNSLQTAFDTYEDTKNAPIIATDISQELNSSLAYLYSSVPSPIFGTTAGEWTVLSLSRGEYLPTSSSYYSGYYDRIVETVQTGGKAQLHSAKSTENSRLIMALSSIGKDSRNVGGYDLVEPLSNFTYVKKQGLNGPVFALIALDTNGYTTSNSNIRQECIDYILSKEISTGGWALSGTTPDPDMTSMTLQSLAPYVSTNAQVAAAVERGINTLSAIQRDSGGYSSWGTINSESCAQVIVALTALGIDPSTDSRFIKNGNSVIDGILDFYVEGGGFQHITSGAGAGINAMATDQATYALVAYQRFLSGKTSLYDTADAFAGTGTGGETPETPADGFSKIAAGMTVPSQIENKAGTKFNAIITLDSWENFGYKLMDCIVNVPDVFNVTEVTMGCRVSGGTIQYNLDGNKLRIVYGDLNNLNDISISGSSFPSDFITIELELNTDIDVSSNYSSQLFVSGMSLKLSSDSFSEDSMNVIDSSNASITIGTGDDSSMKIVEGTSISAYSLYVGDGVDLIPTTKQAVAISVTATSDSSKIVFDGSTEFRYSSQLSSRTGVPTYVAIVASDVSFADLVDVSKYETTSSSAAEIKFGDSNNDGVINAQDALDTVNAWLRKTSAPTDYQILAMNINADSRINTFDTFGIVDYFVNGVDFGIISSSTLPAAKQKQKLLQKD